MNGNPFYVSPLGGLDLGQQADKVFTGIEQKRVRDQEEAQLKQQQERQAMLKDLGTKAMQGDLTASQQLWVEAPEYAAQIDKGLGIQSDQQKQQVGGWLEKYLTTPADQRDAFLQKTASQTPFSIDDDLLAMDPAQRDGYANMLAGRYLNKDQISMLQGDKQQPLQQGSGEMSGYVFNPNTGQYSINPQVQERLESIKAQAEIKDGKVDAKTRQSINKDITQLTKDTTSIRNTAADLEKLSKVGGGPAAIAMVFKFMKALDPQSVVREGEFATAENSAGVDDKILNMYNKLLEGEILTPEQMQQFIGTAKELANSAIDASNSEISNYLDTFEDTLPAGFKSSLKKRIPERFDIAPQNDNDPLGLGI